MYNIRYWILILNTNNINKLSFESNFFNLLLYY